MSAVTALQTALAAEHRAVYLYGVIGARSAISARPRVTRLWERHKLRRDDLIAYLQARKAEPVASAAAYPVADGKTPAELAAQVEADVLTAYVPLAGAPSKALRTYAATAMQDAAALQTRWSRTAPTTPFPGLTPSDLTPDA
ncbi:ferritin-like domain-containing protein [Actinocorallia sp. A-T 12471]|uniref:ferritin-like domain-containing protein n=1 Tax=Actinocorallia sp. A-T 12471 TaxID=3089813 RepID=UPI0029CDDCFA|nr:ferritin-like domain-containing protein [Actinocorallia sp. A-T 12471]MDX6743403.1 ferritin-like domain-containing protein [Actinocorallia sp. A-T 12471]